MHNLFFIVFHKLKLNRDLKAREVLSLSQANFFSFSFIFQVVSRCVYEAFLFYLTNHERPIDWTATVLQRYMDKRRSKDGQHIDFKVEAHRKNFIRKANRHAILNVNGNNFLAKLEKCEDTSTEDNPVYVKKWVICEDEYETLLKDHHDGKNHLRFIKCYYEVRIYFCSFWFWSLLLLW